MNIQQNVAQKVSKNMSICTILTKSNLDILRFVHHFYFRVYVVPFRHSGSFECIPFASFARYIARCFSICLIAAGFS